MSRLRQRHSQGPARLVAGTPSRESAWPSLRLWCCPLLPCGWRHSGPALCFSREEAGDSWVKSPTLARALCLLC